MLIIIIMKFLILIILIPAPTCLQRYWIRRTLGMIKKNMISQQKDCPTSLLRTLKNSNLSLKRYSMQDHMFNFNHICPFYIFINWSIRKLNMPCYFFNWLFSSSPEQIRTAVSRCLFYCEIQSLESLVPGSLTARFGTNIVVFIGSTGLHELPLS